MQSWLGVYLFVVSTGPFLDYLTGIETLRCGISTTRSPYSVAGIFFLSEPPFDVPLTGFPPLETQILAYGLPSCDPGVDKLLGNFSLSAQSRITTLLLGVSPLKVDASNLLMDCTPLQVPTEVTTLPVGFPSLRSNCELDSANVIFTTRRLNSATWISSLEGLDHHSVDEISSTRSRHIQSANG